MEQSMMYHHHHQERIPRDPYYEYQRPHSIASSSSSSPACRPCPICQAPPTSFHADMASGDVICTSCGAVLDQKLRDESAEWRDYSNNPNNNDSVDGAGRKRARCGDAIVDETKYVGGLMPTKLGSTGYSSTGGPRRDEFQGLAAMRQRLKRTHNIIENRIARDQKERYAEILLDRQAREAKARRGETTTTEEENGRAGILVAEGGDDYEGWRRMGQQQQRQERPRISRPSLAQMMTAASNENDDHEERAYASLQNPKWSLSDALLLYGTLEQVRHHLLPSQSPHIGGGSETDDGRGWTQLQLDNERDECKKRIDATARTSLHRLYTAYKLLEGAARALDLYGNGAGAGGGSFSNASFRQAVATLIKFAVKNDGLRVRGISSGGLSSLSTLSLKDGDAASTTALSLSLFGAEGMAWSALFDVDSATFPSTHSSSKTISPSTVLHRLRQYASLGSAILYLAAKSSGVGRTLTEVCSAFGTYAVVHASNKDGGEGGIVPDEPLVRPKYCSRAMQELRAALPEVVSPFPQDGIQVKNDCEILQPSLLSQPALETTSTAEGRTPIKVECIPEIPSDRIVDHVGISSNAVVTADEAALVDLTTRMANSLDLPPMAIQSAAIIALQCARDARDNPTRAQHSTISSKRCTGKSHIRPHRRSRNRAAGGSSEESPDVIAISSILLVCAAGGTMKLLASQAVGSSAAAASSSSFEMDETSEDLNDDFLTLQDETDYSRSREATSPIKSAEGTKTASAHRTNTVSWAAWNDQPPWHRDISQLEQCTGISRKSILAFYSNFLHPRRLFLLGVMSKLEQGWWTSTSSDTKTTTTTMAESAGLLHNVVAAAPLMSLRNIG